MSRPWTPVAGDSLVASLFNALWDWVEGLVGGGLTSESLADDAGIAAEQLADRYLCFPGAALVLVPESLNEDQTKTFATDDTIGYEAPQQGTEIQLGEILIDVRDGLPCSLSHIDFYCKEVEVGSTAGAYPLVKVYRGADLLGGSSIELDTSDHWFRLGATNPHDFPVDALQRNDVLYFKLTSDDVSGAGTGPHVRGLRATAWFKFQLTH